MTITEKTSLCVTVSFPSVDMSSQSDDDGIISLSDEDSLPPIPPNFFVGQRLHLNQLRSLSHRHEFQGSPDNSLMETSVSDYSEVYPPKTFADRTVLATRHPRSTNRVLLHIYDLIASDTLMQLPWGCVCEIGKCFNEVNSALHELGTGAYHVGVECNGIEYAYGCCSQPHKSGVFSCIPKFSPGYQYRTSIDFGEVPLIRSSWVIVPTDSRSSPRSVSSTSFTQVQVFVDGRNVMKEMAAEYMGIDYDILRHNCCTFAAEACVRLGVPEDQIPTWFRNLAETGAYGQDVANATFVEPLQMVLSSAAHDNSLCGENNCELSEQEHVSNDDEQAGFEVIAKRNASNTRDVVVVIDAEPNHRPFRLYRRAASSAY